MAAEGVLTLDDMIRKNGTNQKTKRRIELNLLSIGWNKGDCHKFQQKMFYLFTPPWIMGAIPDSLYPVCKVSDPISQKIYPFIAGSLKYQQWACTRYDHVYKNFISAVHMRPGYAWKMLDPRLWMLVLWVWLTHKEKK
jgi:hypothetical protein